MYIFAYLELLDIQYIFNNWEKRLIQARCNMFYWRAKAHSIIFCTLYTKFRTNVFCLKYWDRFDNRLRQFFLIKIIMI